MILFFVMIVALNGQRSDLPHLFPHSLGMSLLSSTIHWAERFSFSVFYNVGYCQQIYLISSSEYLIFPYFQVL